MVSLRKVVSCIKNNNNFLITTHINLEGDALGSEMAFYRLLKKMGKRATIINEDDVPYGYDFLPHLGRIKKFENDMKNIRFDCFVALDCSFLKRCGKVSRLNSKDKPILNIDHHISNENFGDINWVEPSCSSCAEMIYKLYKKLGLPLDKGIAIPLYVGMLTDTGSFRYPNTTSSTHKAVSELFKYNLNISDIHKNIYQNIPLKDVLLLNKILPMLRCACSGKVAWFQIKRDISRIKTSFDLTENILSFARVIKGVEVVALFKEKPDQRGYVRVNLRSQGAVDVNKVAAFFAGGGHKTASGATVKGNIDQVRKRVLAKIKESLD
ncbi:MAG: bifunctional oligoribonuclease/PAP phosphatase NrnA [Candidatus Omnitrophica bacterium]|nr:bifunctional oligoribonuclease/PAP phosphatase NrnA [Candidatus Omnitrophota bacterium]